MLQHVRRSTIQDRYVSVKLTLRITILSFFTFLPINVLHTDHFLNGRGIVCFHCESKPVNQYQIFLRERGKVFQLFHAPLVDSTPLLVEGGRGEAELLPDI